MAIKPIPDAPAGTTPTSEPAPAPPPATTEASPGETTAEGQGSEAAAVEEDAPILADLADPLKEAYRKLPPEIRKVNNKVFTERAQKLAAREKEIEGQQIILNALKSDPANTIKFLAQQAGLKVEEPAVPKPVTDQVQQELSALFGPEVTQVLLPALEKVIESKTQPLRETIAEQNRKALTLQAQANIEAFKTTHPDFPKHEQAMLKFMERVRPGEDMPHSEFLELAYMWAKRDQSNAQTVKETVEQLNRAAANAQASGQPGGVTATRVAPGPPAGRLPTLREAAEAALRGENWQ